MGVKIAAINRSPARLPVAHGYAAYRGTRARSLAPSPALLSAPHCNAAFLELSLGLPYVCVAVHVYSPGLRYPGVIRRFGTSGSLYDRERIVARLTLLQATWNARESQMRFAIISLL